MSEKKKVMVVPKFTGFVGTPTGDRYLSVDMELDGWDPFVQENKHLFKYKSGPKPEERDNS